MKIRLLIKEGTTRTSVGLKGVEGVERWVLPMRDIETVEPLPTMTQVVEGRVVGLESIPSSNVMWDVAPESMIQPPGTWRERLFMAATRPAESQVGGACIKGGTMVGDFIVYACGRKDGCGPRTSTPVTSRHMGAIADPGTAQPMG